MTENNFIADETANSKPEKLNSLQDRLNYHFSIAKKLIARQEFIQELCKKISTDANTARDLCAESNSAGSRTDNIIISQLEQKALNLTQRGNYADANNLLSQIHQYSGEANFAGINEGEGIGVNFSLRLRELNDTTNAKLKEEMARIEKAKKNSENSLYIRDSVIEDVIRSINAEVPIQPSKATNTKVKEYMTVLDKIKGPFDKQLSSHKSVLEQVKKLHRNWRRIITASAVTTLLAVVGIASATQYYHPEILAKFVNSRDSLSDQTPIAQFSKKYVLNSNDSIEKSKEELFSSFNEEARLTAGTPTIPQKIRQDIISIEDIVKALVKNSTTEHQIRVDAEKNVESKLKTISELNSILDDAKIQLDKTNETVSSMKTDYATLDSSRKSAEARALKAETALSQNSAEFKRISDQNIKDYATLKTENAALKTEKDLLNKNLREIATTLSIKQKEDKTISIETIQQYATTKSTVEQEAKNNKSQLDKKDKNYAILKAENDALKTEKESLENTLADNKKLISDKLALIDALKKNNTEVASILGTPQNNDTTPDIGAVSKYAAAKLEVEQKYATLKLNSSNITELRKNLDDAEKENAEMKETLERIVMLRSAINAKNGFYNYTARYLYPGGVEKRFIQVNDHSDSNNLLNRNTNNNIGHSINWVFDGPQLTYYEGSKDQTDNKTLSRLVWNISVSSAFQNTYTFNRFPEAVTKAFATINSAVKPSEVKLSRTTPFEMGITYYLGEYPKIIRLDNEGDSTSLWSFGLGIGWKPDVAVQDKTIMKELTYEYNPDTVYRFSIEQFKTNWPTAQAKILYRHGTFFAEPTFGMTELNNISFYRETFIKKSGFSNPVSGTKILLTQNHGWLRSFSIPFGFCSMNDDVSTLKFFLDPSLTIVRFKFNKNPEDNDVGKASRIDFGIKYEW